jgi:hypothetical protein
MKKTYIVLECDRCHQIIKGEPIKIITRQGSKDLDMVQKTLNEKDYCLNCIGEMLEFLEPMKETKEMSLEDFVESLKPKAEAPAKEKEEKAAAEPKEKRKPGPKPKKVNNLPATNKMLLANVQKLYKLNNTSKQIAEKLEITEAEVENILECYVEAG